MKLFKTLLMALCLTAVSPNTFAVTAEDCNAQYDQALAAADLAYDFSSVSCTRAKNEIRAFFRFDCPDDGSFTAFLVALNKGKDKACLISYSRMECDVPAGYPDISGIQVLDKNKDYRPVRTYLQDLCSEALVPE